jgi:hypothetical protein
LARARAADKFTVARRKIERELKSFLQISPPSSNNTQVLQR